MLVKGSLNLGPHMYRFSVVAVFVVVVVVVVVHTASGCNEKIIAHEFWVLI